MKKYSGIIGLVSALLCVCCLSIFSLCRNELRNDIKINVHFDKPPLFLSDSSVNKLLTQKINPLYKRSKDSLDLNMLEIVLKDIPTVQNADVFQTPKGHFGILLYERKPLFRVLGQENYYVDRFGKKFPLSKRHVSDVPVFLGKLSDENLEDVVNLVVTLNGDSFFLKELVHLSKKDGMYRIGIRSLPYDFIFGKYVRVKSKIKKLKVFCAFQKEQKSLKKYRSANLIYKNQVVVTTH